MRVRCDAPIEGYVGAAIAAGLLALFGFQTSLQIRLDLYGRTVPATLLESHHLGRGGAICTYAFMAGTEPRTLKGQCYFAPSPSVDYLPGEPDLARCHGQPDLGLDLGVVTASLTLLGVSLLHLRKQRRSSGRL